MGESEGKREREKEAGKGREVGQMSTLAKGERGREKNDEEEKNKRRRGVKRF